MLPSGPSCMASGPAFGVGSGNSVIWPCGVMRPILLADFSANQRSPSGPTTMPIGVAFARRQVEFLETCRSWDRAGRSSRRRSRRTTGNRRGLRPRYRACCPRSGSGARGWWAARRCAGGTWLRVQSTCKDASEPPSQPQPTGDQRSCRSSTASWKPPSTPTTWRARRRSMKTCWACSRSSADSRLRAYGVASRSVLLIFRRGSATQTVTIPGGTIPGHDGAGPLHVAFAIGKDELDAMGKASGCRAASRSKARPSWSRGGRSIYFRDPDGHLLELATPGLWSVY